MDKKLCLHVCYAYLPEVRHIMATGDYPDVRVTGDALNCLTTYRDPLRKEKAAVPCPENDTQVIYIGSSCIRNHQIGKSGKNLPGFHQLDYCHELILCRELVEYYCQRRYYLVSGGWLVNYRKHIADWGFDADTARDFFAGSSDKILFLDTGILGDYHQDLSALSDFMGLPYETLPIGLSHCRNLIDSLVFRWRENKERTQLNDQIARVAKRAADYSMVFEQMQRLVDLTQEEEIVSEVFQLLNLLFAPENIRYQPAASKHGSQELWYKQKPDSLSDPASATLIIKARNQGEVMGSFTLGGLGYPEYLEQYQPMRTLIGGLVGLAIANARKFQAIQENELQLMIYTTELQAANASKDKFFSIIAHDLKNPISAFLGLAELLTDADEQLNPDEMRKTASVIHLSAINVYRLLENLLEWSKIQMTGIQVDLTLLDLDAVVAPEIEMIRNTARNKRITLKSSLGNLKVNTDRDILGFIMRNFLSNAVKFSLPGGTVELFAHVLASNEIEISVQDCGIGMSKEMVGNLFSLHQQTNRKGTGGEPSTGLGLVLCKEFAEKIGASITVDSQVGRGSKFAIILPVGAP